MFRRRASEPGTSIKLKRCHTQHTRSSPESADHVKREIPRLVNGVQFVLELTYWPQRLLVRAPVASAMATLQLTVDPLLSGRQCLG